MAQGGHSSGMDEEDGEETEDFVPLPFMDPMLSGLKKKGDEKFQEHLYEEAAAIYTFALEYPGLPFMDTSVIAEKLFRKRAVCFYKMGKYREAIQDCEGAIQNADCNNNTNLIAKSIFIKMKANVCLGDFVPALMLAVWCKHLRPNCEKTKECLNDLKEKLREAFKKDSSLVYKVLGAMIKFAERLNMENDTRVLALESYTELLDLFNFMLLPGVLQKQAEVLMNLGRYEEAKDVCRKVLWLRDDDLDALELMTEIMKRLNEREQKQLKETVNSPANFPVENNKENKPNDDVTMTSEEKLSQRTEEIPVVVAINENTKRRRKKNKKKSQSTD